MFTSLMNKIYLTFIQPVPVANRSIESPLPAFIVARPRITEVPLYPCESSRCIGATYTYVLLVLIGRQTDSRSSSRGCTDWKIFTFQGTRHGEPFTNKGGIEILKIYQIKKIFFKAAVNGSKSQFTAVLFASHREPMNVECYMQK